MNEANAPRRYALLAVAVALGLLLAGVACGPNDLSEVGRAHAESVRQQAAQQAHHESSWADSFMARPGRAAHLRSVQRSAGPEYRFDHRDRTKAVAANPAQRLTVELADGAVQIRPADALADWQLGLRWTGVGRAGRLEPVPAPAGEANTAANQATYRRVGSEEWYLNGPRGIEQGFVLSERPRGAGELMLELEVTGLEPQLMADGKGVLLASASGQRELRYTDLWATDADGRSLDARVAVAGSTIRLAIDDDEARYPLYVDPLVWAELQKLVADDGEAEDYFGGAVALWGDTALVGAFSDTIGANDGQGSVYVFMHSAGAWTEQDKLTASDGEEGDCFGSSVALHGDTALVGAWGDAVGGNTQQGSAYVFVRAADAWTQQDKLTANDGEEGDYFGRSVALQGDTALVGAPSDTIGANDGQGSAYVFVRAADAWTQQDQLIASDGQPGDYLGIDVSLDGDTALIGASYFSGAAYEYVRAAGAWTFQNKLTASDSVWDDNFGGSVALYGDTALIGADRADVHGDFDEGAAYVFVRAAGAWSQQQRLWAADAAAGAEFGKSVSLQGDRALIGASRAAIGANYGQGAAYLFARVGGEWLQQEKLTAGDGRMNDELGSAATLYGSTALIGAPDADINASAEQGAVYVFQHGWEDGDPCTQGSDCLSSFCVDGVCCDRECGAGDPNDCEACSELAGAPEDGTCWELPNGAACGGRGWTCSAGECLAPNGADCMAESECQSGNCLDEVCCEAADCGPYRCGPQGSCHQACDSTLQCATDYVCTAERQCAPPPADGGDEGGCRMGARPQAPAWWAALLISGLAMIARRRRLRRR